GGERVAGRAVGRRAVGAGRGEGEQYRVGREVEGQVLAAEEVELVGDGVVAARRDVRERERRVAHADGVQYALRERGGVAVPELAVRGAGGRGRDVADRKSTRLNSSHVKNS